MLRKGFKYYFKQQNEKATMEGFTKWLTITDSASLSSLVSDLLGTYFKK